MTAKKGHSDVKEKVFRFDPESTGMSKAREAFSTRGMTEQMASGGPEHTKKKMEGARTAFYLGHHGSHYGVGGTVGAPVLLCTYPLMRSPFIRVCTHAAVTTQQCSSSS